MAKRQGPLHGARFEITQENEAYPSALKLVANPPKTLYVMGNPAALQEGLAVVGARRATPYGLSCARRFAGMAANRGITIVSGGARGCDATAHEAALKAGGLTVAFLGGGIDEPYPAENKHLFQRIIDCGGAVVSEHEWDFHPMPFAFRERNRLIAGLARATLIVEAGLPSGTFSTADAALAAGREVLVIPGAITSKTSRGANRLLYQGATPVVDDDSFADILFGVFGCLKQEEARDETGGEAGDKTATRKPGTLPVDLAAQDLLRALQAETLSMEELHEIARRLVGDGNALTWLMVQLAMLERDGRIARYPDGRYGPFQAVR